MLILTLIVQTYKSRGTAGFTVTSRTEKLMIVEQYHNMANSEKLATVHQ